MLFYIPKELYSKEVLFKTCYRFTDEYYIHLSSNNDSYSISIESKDNSNCVDYEKLFKNELIEQANREIVFKETKNIREILFARSLSSSMIYTGTPNESIDTNVNDNSAMKDWFDGQ